MGATVARGAKPLSGIERDALEIAIATQRTDQDDAVGDRLIKQDDIADDDTVEILRQFGACPTQEGPVRDQFQLVLDRVEEAIGGGDVILGDVGPEVEQIIDGTRVPKDSTHAPPSSGDALRA